MNTTRSDAILNGVRPRRGLWLVNTARRRVYGQIVMVRSTGVVVWHSSQYGVGVSTEPGRLYDGGYSYSDESPHGYERAA